MLWKEDIEPEDVVDLEWHQQQEEAEYPRDYHFERAVSELMVLYRRQKSGFDLNRLDLSLDEWDVIVAIGEWFDAKKQEREDALLGVKKINGL